MGGVFSCGKDNEDLVNMLIFHGYIRAKSVERVFRAVDRGDYLIPSHKDLAYKDLSWKFGNYHLSAPCVYCEVMQGLTLKPGLSFLNIGSGTGYLSTMAGLILGRNGTNHGIEMHQDCLMYAYDHLEEFKSTSLDVDSFEFCEPVFQLGNILNVTPSREYDRVYCGAACPEIHEKYIKQFVKIGGILVMPFKDNLLRIERLGETSWRNTMMLPVSFASLVTPPEGKEGRHIQLPLSQPQSLQELCRSLIRCHLRKLVWSEHKDLECKVPITANSIERSVPLLHFGIPFFEEPNRGQSDSDSSVVDDDDDDEDDEMLDRAPNFSHIQARRREVVSSTLRLVRAVVQPSGNQVNQESREDSEEIDHLSSARESEPENSTKDPSNNETEMQEADFFELANHAPMEDGDFPIPHQPENPENSSDPKPTAQDAQAEDFGAEASNRCSRSSESKLKRKSEACESNGGPHTSLRRLYSGNRVPGENSGEKSATTSFADLLDSASSESDEDDDDEDNEGLLNYAWIEQAFSILKDKFETEMEQNSETSDSSSEGSENETKNRPETENPDPDSDEDDGGLFERLMASKSAVRGAENASSDRENPGNGSSESAAAKSDANGKSADAKTPENPEEDPKTKGQTGNFSDSSSDEEDDERIKFQRTLRSGQKRRSGQREQTEKRDASDCSDSSGDDLDYNTIYERNLKRNAYTHTIRKTEIADFMRKKVGKLPLPLPLRLYLNYNREL